MKQNTKKITTLAMLAALALIVTATVKVPVVLFLSYKPTDVILTIGGFLYGPMAAFATVVVVAFVEMLTLSNTGLIGLIMNVISGCAFVCTAAFIYKKNRTLKGAVLGLMVAALMMTAVMVMWNYLITPLYMNAPREQIVALLLPAFIPFNLLKGVLNAAITMLLYKPIKKALQASHMMPPASETAPKGKFDWGVVIISIFVIVTCILWVLVLQGHL